MSYRLGSAAAGVIHGSVLVAALAAMAPVAAQAQVKQPTVTVVNPTSNPVNARITNAVVPVEISNADAIPVAAQDSEGGREIYTKSVTVDFGGGSGSCNGDDPVTVPAGKRLVIEYLSATSTFDNSIRLVSVSLQMAGGKLLAVAPATSTAFNGSLSYSAAGQYVHAYSDGNLLACAIANGANSDEMQVNITGYLVDKP